MKSYFVKIMKDGKELLKISTKSKYKLSYRFNDFKWIKGAIAYVKITYGKGLNAFDEISIFKNEGFYNSKKDTKWAISAFDEISPKELGINN